MSMHQLQGGPLASSAPVPPRSGGPTGPSCSFDGGMGRAVGERNTRWPIEGRPAARVVTALGWSSGWPYGGMGVEIARAMRSVFPNSESKSSKARAVVWIRIEKTSARRRSRRARRRSSGLHSTRHTPKDPRLASWISSETFRESSVITHLPQFRLRGFARCVAGAETSEAFSTLFAGAEQGNAESCGASLLGVALVLQETGAALAGM